MAGTNRARLRGMLLLLAVSAPSAGQTRGAVPPVFAETFERYRSEAELDAAWGESKKAKKGEVTRVPPLVRPGLGATGQAIRVEQGTGFAHDFTGAGDVFTLSLRVKLLGKGRSVTVALRSSGNRPGPYISFGKAPGYLTVQGQEPGRADLPTKDYGGGRYGVLPFVKGREYRLQIVADCRRRVYRVYLDGKTDGREYIFFKGKRARSLSRLDLAGVYGGASAIVDEIRIDRGDAAGALPAVAAPPQPARRPALRTKPRTTPVSRRAAKRASPIPERVVDPSERRARSQFKVAEMLFVQGQRDMARERFSKLVTAHPHTTYAAKAQEYLARLQR